MQRILAILQGLCALTCGVLVMATTINLGFILTRPDSVSVANVVVAQLLWIIVLSATAAILLRKARRNLSGRR